MRLFFFFIFFLFLSSSVLAIGVSPADYKIDFEPGLEKTFSYRVLNNRNHPINARIELVGEESNKYFSLPEKLIPLAAEGTASFQVKMKLPEEFERAGWHRFPVKVVEDFESMRTGMVVRTASIVPIKVFVPFPGEYAEITLKAYSVEVDKQSRIEAVVLNRGTEPLSETTLTISIRDMNGNIQKEWVEEGINLDSQKSREFVKYSPYELEPGKYYVVARYDYAGKKITRETSFKIGTREAHPIKITDYLAVGKVSQFEVTVENYWNEPISGVYAIVNLAGKEGSTSPTILKPFKSGKVAGFIDLTDVDPQNTTAKVTVLFDNYKSPVEEYSVELYVPPEPIIEKPESIVRIDNKMVMFVVALIVLVIAALIIILMGKKDNGKRKEEKEF